MSYAKNLQYAPTEMSLNHRASNLNSKKVSVLIDNGFTLIQLSKSANIIFGKVLALEYLSLMGMNITGVFLGFNIFKAISTYEPALILHCMTSYCLVIIYAIRFYSYAKVGQSLCNAYQEINEGLGLVLMHDNICDGQRRKLEFLVNCFSITSPIRPLDMFDMNFAHFAVLSNIMFTYNIILMQFKGY